MDPAEIAIFLSETLAGGYRPKSFLGSGNFSGAFLAEDMSTGGDVAAKVLKLVHCSRADAVQEFSDEVSLLGKLAGCDRVVALLASGDHSVSLAHGPSGGAIAVTTQFAILELAVCSLSRNCVGAEGAQELGLWQRRDRLHAPEPAWRTS